MNVLIPQSEWPADWQAAADRKVCLHCGNGLGHFWKAEDGPFCCRGCTNVYQMIHQADLGRFYDLQAGAQAPAANLTPSSHDWLDRMLAESAVDSETGGVVHLDLDIQGVHCAACVWLVEELFRRQAAGLQLRINPTLGKVELSWDTARGDLKDFLVETEKFGYRLGPPAKGERTQTRGLLMRMAVSIAMAMNVMMFSLSYYFGLAPTDGPLYVFLGWMSLALATVSMIAGGGVFFKGAVQGLRHRIAHLDVPISLGMILAYSGSVYGFLAGGPEHTYFDSLTVFIALMLVGRWAQEHILQRNRNALLESVGAENLSAKRLRNEVLETVAASEIRQGDEIWVAPGDLVPVEGILMRHSTDVSLDWISGESDQVAFHPGDAIPAGAFNASRQGFSITSNQDFADSRLQDLLRSSTMADEDYHPQWWHNISTWYVNLVLLAAAAGFLSWSQDIETALKVTISILVVTCPCALGLATPLAEELIHFALRRAGVFLRKQSFLEKALDVRKVLLDKTGTLTLGQLVLADRSREVLEQMDPVDRGVLRMMTARSNHPVSVCLHTTLSRMCRDDEALNPVSAETLLEIPGSGLELKLSSGLWRLGRPDFAIANYVPDTMANRELTGSSSTPFTCDGQVVAVFQLSEELKADARSELNSLREAGFSIYLVSGDTTEKVQRAARALGVDPAKAFGGLTPEAKAEVVQKLDDRDTLMVGDGLNDSPSFEVALCAATPAVDRPVLPGKADFYFMGDGIAAIRRSLLAARHLRRVVRTNLVIAVFYNLIAVGLCLAALVTPVVAAILMPISSIAVVSLTAMRLAQRRLRWM
jgi:P-type Cu2+ transporter